MKYLLIIIYMFMPYSAIADVKCSDILTAKTKTLRSKFNELLSKNTPWEFTLEQEARFSRIINDESTPISERVEKLFIQITEVRLEALSLPSQKLAGAAYRSALSQDSIYSRTLGRVFLWLTGPHYNQIFNRIAMYKSTSELDRGVRAFIATHEVEHAIDRNTQPVFFSLLTLSLGLESVMSYFRTPFSPVLKRKAEASAVSSQWELVSRLPKRVRKDLIEELTSKTPKRLSAEKEALISTVIEQNVLEKVKIAIRSTLKIKDKFQIRNVTVAKLLFENHKNLDFFIKSSELESLDDKSRALLNAIKGKGLNSQEVQKIMQEIPNPAEGNYIKADILRRILGNIGGNIHLSAFRYLFITSLENAHLPKEEFLKAVSKEHGYSLKQLFSDHYRLKDGIKLGLLINGMFIILNEVEAGQTSDNYILAHDLRIIWSLTSSFFGLP